MMSFVHLSQDQKSITIQFDSTNGDDDVSTFYAGWLWSNNPNYIHLSSKQRQVTPGSYRGSRITHAVICDVSQLMSSGTNSNVIIPSPPPPAGYCHPIYEQQQEEEDLMIGNFNGTNNDQPKTKHHRQNQQLLLCLTWEDSTLSSYYDLDWLRSWRYDNDSLRRRREQTEVTFATIHSIDRTSSSSYLEGGELGGVPVFDYSTVIVCENNTATGTATLERGVYNVLHAIFTKGAAIISNTPSPHNTTTDDGSTPVAILGKALCGHNLSHGMLYGDLFHVQSSSSQPNNIAFTSLPLRPHQDLAYYESMPGLQLLHCVEFDDSIVGGESILVDCLAAAYQFKLIAPDQYFKTLTTVPATFVKQRQGANMVYQRPHIVLKSSSDDEIVAVNWSPPFEGPLRCPPQYVEEYYAAYRALELMLDENASVACGSSSDNDEDRDDELSLALSAYAKKYTWKYRLKPGEILIFNNRRMVHGRCGFTNINTNETQDVKRHLVGCYTNIDDTLNRYRTLHNKFGNEEKDALSHARNVGNGSSFVS